MAYNKQDHDDYIKNEQAFFEWKQKIYQINHKLNQEQDHQMKQQRRMQMVMTRSLGGGGVLGTAMSLMQNMASLKQQNYQMLKQLKQKEKTDILSPIEAKQRNMLAGNTTSNNVFSKLDKTFDKFFGGDSKWNKMFGGQGKTAAAGIGLGAAAGGLALGKALIDSSPLLQQMLKLMKFGFMLILKPIGDFFGMIMRPIMILMLRKFIIPFYQSAYPWFAKTGMKLGEDITKILDALTNEQTWAGIGVATSLAIAALIAGGKFFTDKYFSRMGKAVATAMKTTTTITPTPNPNPPKPNPTTPSSSTTTPSSSPTANLKPKASTNPTANLINQGNQINNPNAITTKKQPTPRSNISSGTASTYSKNPAVKSVQKFMSRIGDVWQRRPDMGIDSIKKQVNSFMSKHKGAAGGYIDTIKDVLSKGKFWAAAGKLGANVMKGGNVLWGLLQPMMEQTMGFRTDLTPEEKAKYYNPDGTRNDQYDQYGNDRMMARGGMINERVDGIGRTSGKKYTIGEAGSEMVIPMSKMGKMGGGGSTTVNINISNMSGDANDLNKLRSTILEVMQTVNVNRGR
jgi:hypothetical protein